MDKKKKGDKSMEAIVRPFTPVEGLEKSIKQMLQLRKGPLSKRSVFELLDELDAEDDESSEG